MVHTDIEAVVKRHLLEVVLLDNLTEEDIDPTRSMKRAGRQ